MAGRGSSAATFEGAPSPSPAPPVFIDTNLDTHLAMIVSPEDTVADLKRKVSMEHLVCFPNIGDISVHSMKVRRRATYYHLSDSMLVRTAFDGIKRAWFLHMDVAPINSDGNIPGGGANNTKWQVAHGDESADCLVKADSTIKLNDPPLPTVSLVPGVSGENQPSRLELPSSDLLFDSETRGNASKSKSVTTKTSGKSEKTKTSGKSEKAAPALGNRSVDVGDPECHEPFFVGNGVSGSHFQLLTDISTDQLNKNVEGKDCANVTDVANDGGTCIVAVEKKKSRKRSKNLEDDHLLISSPEKNRHMKEEGKEQAVPCNDHDNDLLKVSGTENALSENITGAQSAENLGILFDVCSQLQKDDSVLPHELIHEKIKRKKKKRKESKECDNEPDATIDPNASDGFKNLTLRTGLSEHASNEGDLTFRTNAIKDNWEKQLPINDIDLGEYSVMIPVNEKYDEDRFDENHVEVDSEVPVKENKRNARKSKKKATKGESSSSGFSKAEMTNTLGHQSNGENPEVVPVDESKYLVIDPNVEIAPEDVSHVVNAAESLPEVLPSDGRSSIHSKKKSCKAGIVHHIGKKVNGEKAEEVPANDLKYPAVEPNGEIISKEASRPTNAVEILTDVLPEDGKGSRHSKKRSGKIVSSKVKSSKDGTSSSAPNIPEEITVVAEKFTEANSTVPHTNKTSSRSKKKSVNTKESCAEAQHVEDPPIADLESFTDQSLTYNHAETGGEKATFGEVPVPKAIQKGLVKTEGGQITKESHKRKAQHRDTVNGDLVGSPEDLAVKQQSKSYKQKAAKTSQAMHKKGEGKGKSDMPDGFACPHSQSLRSSLDHQMSDYHDQDISTVNRWEEPAHHAELKRSIDYLSTGAHVGEQKTGANTDNSMKETNTNPAASSDTTEEDTSYNEKLYRVAVRKVPGRRSRKDVSKSKQEEIFLNATDNIFGHFTSTSSEDEVEEQNGRDSNKNISNNSLSDDSEEDFEQPQVIVGPIVQENTSSQGVASPSPPHLPHKEEASCDDILLSQDSKAAKKRIALSTLLRSSQSYRRAKLTSQSQTDDTESQPVDVVPETQPDSP